MPSKVRILDPPHQQKWPLTCDGKSGCSSDVSIGVPGAPRCTPSVAATSGTYLARPVAAAVEQGAGHDEALGGAVAV
jgi:hypothetical protein